MKHVGTQATGADLATQGQHRVVTLTIPFGSMWQASVVATVADATAASKVLCSLQASALDENDPEDMEGVTVMATPDVGVITFDFSFPGPFGGPITVCYFLG